MKITLITVCFRSAALIRTALESVLSQKGVDYEYWVVDGGSDDGTVEILREYEPKFGGRMRWISEPDKGLYDAMDKGIARATGDVVGILNADDVFTSDDVLARIAQVFEGRDALECVFGNVRFVRDDGGAPTLEAVRGLPTRRVCFARHWRPWMLHWGYMPPHPAIFIRRRCFAQWGDYVPSREEYRIAADYELLVRFFCRNRMTYRYAPVCTTTMRMGGVSTRDVEARRKLNAEIIKGNRVNGYFSCWPMLLPKYAVKIWEVILPRLGLMR